MRILKGHTGRINSVIITPDSKYIISASVSSDQILRVWDLKTQKIIASFFCESELECCAVASDGVTIVAGDYSGKLHFLKLEI